VDLVQRDQVKITEADKMQKEMNTLYNMFAQKQAECEKMEKEISILTTKLLPQKVTESSQLTKQTGKMQQEIQYLTDHFTKSKIEQDKMQTQIGYLSNTLLAGQAKHNAELQTKGNDEMDTAGALMKAHETALAHREKTILDFVD